MTHFGGVRPEGPRREAALRPEAGAQRTTVRMHAARNQQKRPLKGVCLVGAPGGIRTPNLLIRSQMLYPLSYGRSVRN